MQKILISTDHAGFELKNELKKWLEGEGHEVKDFGAYEFNNEDDFTQFTIPLAKEISKDPSLKGIIIGGSGQGEAIAANRFKGVRAVVFQGQPKTYDGMHPMQVTREHNDSNVISLGSRFITIDEAKSAVSEWLKEPFANKEKYIRRIQFTDQFGSSA